MEKLRTPTAFVKKRAAAAAVVRYVGVGMLRDGWMRDILARRREEGTFRELRTPEQDRCFVDFTSNDFLGLGRAAGLRHAIERETTRVRQACSTLHGLYLTETPTLVVPGVCVYVASRYSFQIQPASRVGRVAYTARPSCTFFIIQEVRAIFLQFELFSMVVVSG